ncbi:MAG: beta strand repeat-containing protein, partial [Candidatus Micrarchaeia archaeon]
SIMKLFGVIFALSVLAILGMANAAISYTSNTITTPIDYPQNAIYTISSISGGVLPYIFNAYYTTANVPGTNLFIGSNAFSPGTTNAIIITINSISANSLEVTAYNGVQSTSSELFSNTISTGTSNTIYGAWAFNAFFANSTSANTISSVNTLIINPALNVSISPEYNFGNLDVGQTLSFKTTINGGTPQFTLTYSQDCTYFNCGSLSANSDILSTDGTNTIVFTAGPSSDVEDMISVSVADSSNSPVTKSASSQLEINAVPTATSLTPSNTVLDMGQYETYNVLIYGGTIPITANLIYVNGPSGATVDGKTPGNVIGSELINSLGTYDTELATFPSFNSFSTNGAYTFNVVATDSSVAGPVTFNSISKTITVDPALSVSISPTSSALDVGQTISLTTTVSGGTPNFSIAYSGNGLCGTLSVVSNTLTSSGSSNTIIFTSNSEITSTCTANIMASVTDSASTNSIMSANSLLTVNPALGTPTITPTATNTLDEGQPITISASVNGGTSPYTYNYIISQYGTPSNVIAEFTESSIQSTNSIIWTTNAIGTFVANIIVTDSATTHETTNSSYSANIVVNPALSVSISPTSSALDIGQTLPLATSVTGGTPSFAISYSLSNSICGSLSTQSNTLSADGTNTIIFTPNSAITGACTTFFTANVEDSASTNSIMSANSLLTVNPAASILVTTYNGYIYTNSIMYGYYIISNAIISNGTGIYSYPTWKLNGNTIISMPVSGNAITSNIITLASNGKYLPIGSYILSVNAFDIGSSTPYAILSSNTFTIYRNNTLTASSSGNPGTSYYGYSVSITFTGTPTIRHQAKWSLYVNGALYGTTNSSITYYEQFASPNTYNFVFNLTNDANYTPYTYTASLVIILPPTASPSTPSTTVATNSTNKSSTTPTTSVNTTIPQSQTSNNISSTISVSSPITLNLPNAMATVQIYSNTILPVSIQARIANATNTIGIPKPPLNYTLLRAVNISVNTKSSISLFFEENYPCSINSSLIKPFIIKNNAWDPISNYTINSTICAVSFYIPNDPIVGIFEKTNLTTITNSLPAVTTSSTTAPTTSKIINQNGKIIKIAAIIIVVIFLLIVAYKMKHKKYHGYYQ